MSKLILSSCDFRNPSAKQVIVENLKKPLPEIKVLFIPNERPTRNQIHSGRFERIVSEYGFSPANILIFDYYDPEKFINLDIDLLYISGGNTFKTMRRLRACGFDKEIVRYIEMGVDYVGGSAGAHIMEKDMTHVKAYDSLPATMNDLSGLGLIDGYIICHYCPERETLYKELADAGCLPIYPLTNDDSIVIEYNAK